MITLGTKKTADLIGVTPTTRPRGALVLLWWVRSRNRRKRLLRRGVGATGGRLGACFKARTKAWGNPSSLHSFIPPGWGGVFFCWPPQKKKTDLNTRFTWRLVWLDVSGAFRMSVAVKCCHFVLNFMQSKVALTILRSTGWPWSIELIKKTVAGKS